jgi:hypothetical protein
MPSEPEANSGLRQKNGSKKISKKAERKGTESFGRKMRRQKNRGKERGQRNTAEAQKTRGSGAVTKGGE